MKIELILIRHGKTEASLKRQYCGQNDLALCPEGIEEIEEFKKQGLYSNLHPELYYTSGLRRATQTLRIIFPEADYYELPELQEMNFGNFEMFTHEQLEKNSDYQNFINDTTGDYVCPGGESANGFYAKVDRGYIKLMEDIIAKGARSALVVSHGGPISRFIQKYTFSENYYEAQPSQGRGYELSLDYSDKAILVLDKKKI